MTNSVVESYMQEHIEYGTSELESYRSVTQDAIKIYGFRIKKADSGKVKARFRIENGLRKEI